LLEQLRGVDVEVSSQGRVLTVTLSNPERRNVQSPSLWAALASLGAQIPSDVDIVVLDATGPAFSAGLDTDLLTAEASDPVLHELVRQPIVGIEAAIHEYQTAFTWWHHVDATTIAVVQGPAVGAGCQLALACDLRIASESAFFSLPEASLGLVPDLGGITRLVPVIGRERTLDIVTTGRRVTAAEAADWGLVSRAVPDGDLLVSRNDVLGALLALPPAVLREARQLVRAADGTSERDHLVAQAAAQARLLGGVRQQGATELRSPSA
jgi:enoyl-CoA hydratase/carnithine racemase